MPQIPTYDSRQAQERGLPNVRQGGAPAGVFDANSREIGQIGNSLAEAGRSIEKEEKLRVEQDDATAVFKAEASVRESYLGFQNEARQRQGINANGVAKDVASWWDKQAKDTMGALGNDRQRALFITRIREIRNGSLEKWSSFEASEKSKAEHEAGNAAMSSAIELAAADPFNTQLLDNARKTIRTTGAYLATKSGDSPEVQEQNILSRTSTLHSAIVQQMLDTNPARVREYLNTYGNEMTAAARGSAEKQLATGEKQKFSQDVGDYYEAKLRGGLMTEQQALDEISSKYEGEQEKAAKLEFKGRMADLQRVAGEEERKAADEAWNIYSQTKRVSAIPAALRSRMNGKDWMAIEDDARRRADSNAAKFPSTDWDLYAALRQKAINDPEEFKKMDLRTYFPQLGKGERESLLDLKGKADKPDHLKDVATLDQQIGAATEAVDIKKEDKGRLRQAIYTDIDAIQKRTGKVMTQDERQKRIDYWLVEGEIPGLLNDREMRRFQAKGAKDGDKWVGTGQKFENGKVYTDGNGVRRRYQNGKWEKP